MLNINYFVELICLVQFLQYYTKISIELKKNRLNKFSYSYTNNSCYEYLERGLGLLTLKFIFIGCIVINK